MAQTIKLKRSATAGNTPTTSQLALGELGINTTDGKLFLKKSVSGTESVVEVGSGDSLPLSGGSLTGSIDVTGSVVADGLTVDGNVKIDGSSDLRYRIYNSGTFKAGLQVATTAGDMIAESQVGDFAIRSQGNLLFSANGNAQRLKINSSGIDVTGTVVADGLTVSGTGYSNATFTSSYVSGGLTTYNLGPSGALLGYIGNAYQLFSGSTSDFAVRAQSDLVFATGGNNQRQRIASNGDISFYNGSGNQGLFWDSSAEALCLGNTGASAKLDIRQDSGFAIRAENGSGSYFRVAAGGATEIGGNLDVTGSVVADGLTVTKASGDIATLEGSGTTSNVQANLVFNPVYDVNARIVSARDGSGLFSRIAFETGVDNTGNTIQRLNIGSHGDISFYNTAGTSQNFFWDSSTSRLGLGTTVPSAPLSVMANTSASVPAAGADSSHLAVGKNDQYGTMIGSLGSGDGYIQQQRFDGNTATYNLLVQPNGGRVGIGTSSPTANLEISSASNPEISIASTVGSTSNFLNFKAISHTQQIQTQLKSIDNGDFTSDLAFLFKATGTGGALTEKMRIDSSGRVGIGTSSPDEKLDITGGYLKFNGGDYGLKSSHGLSYNANEHYFNANNSSPAERMRISSDGSCRWTPDGTNHDMTLTADGNLLVGKTSVDVATAGTCLRGNVSSIFTVSGSVDTQVAIFNRTSLDGTILDFRKDGSTVGSIGSQYRGASGDSLYFVAGDTGIIASPSDDSIVPVTTNGAGRDAAINLGTSSTRFKNLYLSANAYFSAHISPHGDNAYINMLGSNRIQFLTNGQEAARIDASQNLLVGTTAVQGAGGVTLASAGYVYASRPSSTAIYADRTGSDGAIIEFRKNSSATAVGSIGTYVNLPYIGKADVNLLFDPTGPHIIPRGTNGGARDAAINLGSSTNRFKDLYLSGKVTAADIYNAAGGHVIDLNNTDSTIINDPDNHSCLLLSGGDYDTNYYSNDTHYFRGRDALDIHAIIDTTGIKSLGDYKVGSQTVIDASRNLTNIGTISSGAITSSGNITASGGYLLGTTIYNSGNYTILNSGGTGWHSIVERGTGDNYTVKALGGFKIGNSVVIDASRAITNCTGITLTGGSISSYGSVTAGLGSFLVGTRGKMGQVSNDLFVCSTTSGHSGLRFANGAIHPTDHTGAQSDSAQIDLGAGSYRFNDIYARNSTILTSDRNEKQDIEELSDAEQRVAVRAKGLIRKFKWKDAVVEKGDDARIHFGIVAQDLQAAFAAEGLDAGDYGVFISNTWTNEDGHEQTRMGVRYGELLAFIISAI